MVVKDIEVSGRCWYVKLTGGSNSANDEKVQPTKIAKAKTYLTARQKEFSRVSSAVDVS